MIFFLDAFRKASKPENFKTLCGSSSPRQEYGFGDEDLIYVSLLGFVRKNFNIRHAALREGGGPRQRWKEPAL